MRRNTIIGLLAFVGMLCACSQASAQQQVRVTIENLQGSSGFYFTPVFAGFHSGDFDLFDVGQTLDPTNDLDAALESLAEEGSTAGLITEFGLTAGRQAATINEPGGLGPGLFAPGSTTSRVFDLTAAQTHFTYASMLIPTNDAFVGSETAVNLFDGGGAFVGLDRTLALENVWDAGTELNDGLGAPFSTTGGTSTDDRQGIALHSQLGNYDGDTNGAGETVNVVVGSNVFRITVTAVPEPSSMLVIGAVSLGIFTRRRRR